VADAAVVDAAVDFLAHGVFLRTLAVVKSTCELVAAAVIHDSTLVHYRAVKLQHASRFYELDIPVLRSAQVHLSKRHWSPDRRVSWRIQESA
jgi:hypothetical protein